MSDSDDELSPYQLLRLEHIKRNQEYMVQLGLGKHALSAALGAPPAKKAMKKPRAKQLPQEPTRRSGRASGAAPDYTGERIDSLGAGRDIPLRGGAGRSPTAASPSPARVDYVALARDAQRWLEQSRASLVSGVAAGAPADAWHREAINRWGDGVPAAGELAEGVSWEVWTSSRLSSPPPATSLEFLQEFYAFDSWQLMSRVSSHETKERCISSFFELCNTPSKYMSTPAATMIATIRPLGLTENRMRSLLAISEKFLSADEFRLSTDAKSGDKVWGCGPFTVDSFYIFCKHPAGESIKPTDTALQQFVAHLKKHHAGE